METFIRNSHAFQFYDLVFAKERQKGKSYEEASSEAYDAVELRFGISKKTLQNYATRERVSGKLEKSAFERDNAELCRLLQSANEGIVSRIRELQDMLARNNRLLEILQTADETIH